MGNGDNQNAEKHLRSGWGSMLEIFIRDSVSSTIAAMAGGYVAGVADSWKFSPNWSLMNRASGISLFVSIAASLYANGQENLKKMAQNQPGTYVLGRETPINKAGIALPVFFFAASGSRWSGMGVLAGIIGAMAAMSAAPWANTGIDIFTDMFLPGDPAGIKALGT